VANPAVAPPYGGGGNRSVPAGSAVTTVGDPASPPAACRVCPSVAGTGPNAGANRLRSPEEPDRQLLQAVVEVRADPDRWAGELDLRERREQLLEEDPALETGQVHPQTEV